MNRDFTATVTLNSDTSGDTRGIHGKSVVPEGTAITGADLYYGHGNKSKNMCE
jgi:hypothetical protein